MLTVKTAAERAGVSPGLVYAWVTGGQLAHFRLGRLGSRGGIRIAEADLDAFLATLKQGGRQNRLPPAPRKPIRLKHLGLS